MDILTDSRQVRRLEIVETGRRRRWSAAEKLRIVEESFSGPRLVSATARHHGLSKQLLFSWRIWPSVAGESVTISPAQLSYLLDHPC